MFSWYWQLAKNGKRVLMVGDDTWLQLFPNHFAEIHAYPSFNVKDLHTVLSMEAYFSFLFNTLF